MNLPFRLARSLVLAVGLAAAPILAAPLAAAGGGAGSGMPHHPAWMTSKPKAFDKAKAEKKMVIIDAYADWCGWCKKLDRDVFDTDRFIAAAKKDYVLLRLNTEDGADGSAYARQHQIANLPTTMVLDADGTVVGRIAGYVKFEEFMGHLDRFRKGYLELRARDEESRGKKAADVALAQQVATEWEQRGESRRAMQAWGRVADQKTAPADARARAAFAAATNALRVSDLPEAEKRAGQLDRIQPFPADLDGMPEILRSDIAAMRGDLEGAIRMLEELLEKGNPEGTWRATLPNRINELKNSLRFQQYQKQNARKNG